MPLTDLAIRHLASPVKGAKVYPDDAITGFGVRVSHAGTKTYVLTYGPQRTRITIGRVGVVKLSEARDQAKRILAEHTLGKHRPKPMQWQKAVDEYLAEIGQKRKVRTLKDYTRLLARFPFGDTRLEDLSPHDITKRLDKLKNTPAEHIHAYTILRGFIRWAHRKHYFDRDPMERMQPPGKYKKRERVLSEAELKIIYNTAHKAENAFQRYVYTLIHTGYRRGEGVALKWAYIASDSITLPGELTKNGQPHTLPIGPRFSSFLHSNTFPNTSDYLFPAARSHVRGKPTTHITGFGKLKREFDKECGEGVANYTLHDLRRTFATFHQRLGTRLEVVENLINHISGSRSGVVGIYQRHKFMDEMREAMIAWEDFLHSLLSD